MTAYQEIVDFLTSGPTLEEIVKFQPSESTSIRARYLAKKRDTGKLTLPERDEWKEFARAEQFLEAIRARAKRRLGT